MPWPACEGETFSDDVQFDEQPHSEQIDAMRMRERFSHHCPCQVSGRTICKVLVDVLSQREAACQ